MANLHTAVVASIGTPLLRQHPDYPHDCPLGAATIPPDKIMDRMRHGKGRLEDLDILLEVGKSIGIMPGTTICGLADGAGWPVKNAIMKFRGEFEEFIRSGRKSAEIHDFGH